MTRPATNQEDQMRFRTTILQAGNVTFDTIGRDVNVGGRAIVLARRVGVQV